jgi:hypothetical protein
LGRSPLADPNELASFEPGAFWARSYSPQSLTRFTVLAPMDSRTTASPAGTGEYTFYRTGGLSWSMPYIAGVYALAAQTDPSVTPQKFWSLARETGSVVETEIGGRPVSLGPIINPTMLVDALATGRP